VSKCNWKMVGRPEPKGEGQRFFILNEVWNPDNPAHRVGLDRAIREGGVKLYVADNSGLTPDDTDDGPLVLDRSTPIRIVEWNGRVSVDAAVICERDERDHRRRSCGFTEKEAAWLVEHAGYQVEISPEVRGTFEIYAMLLGAAGASATATPTIAKSGA